VVKTVRREERKCWQWHTVVLLDQCDNALDGGTSLEECNGFLGSERKGYVLRRRWEWEGRRERSLE